MIPFFGRCTLALRPLKDIPLTPIELGVGPLGPGNSQLGLRHPGFQESIFRIGGQLQLAWSGSKGGGSSGKTVQQR